jgi:hypothetical protein
MKKSFLIVPLILALFFGTAFAESFWVGDVTGSSGGKAANVMNFDWASSGSGLVVGAIQPNETVDFLYQSYLFALTDPGGNPVGFPGLNTDFEYTIVAKFPEQVLSVSQISPTTTLTLFKTLPGGQFFIYHDAPVDANVLSGTGFNDGSLVAQGYIASEQFFSYTLDSSSGVGLGSAILAGTVTYANPLYLDPAANIIDFRFEGLMNSPPTDSTTLGFFDGHVVAANDLLLKVDGSHKFGAAEDVPGDCRVTAGGVRDGLTVSCELKSNGTPDPKTCVQTGFDTWGGQAGAQPGVDGNWTHHNSLSSKQSFVFHSNDLFWISCSDPGTEECSPATANAEFRQIDFSGIGRFNNLKGQTLYPALQGVTVGEDLCFSVHLEDIGEPGPGGRWPSADGECTHCPGTNIDQSDCVNCTDYYEIRIYDSSSHDSITGTCEGNIIYTNGPGVAGCDLPPLHFGYFTRAGNVQMHPQNN